MLLFKAEALAVKVIPYIKLKDKILTPSDFSVFCYSQLKLPECLHTTVRFDKNEPAFV